jgi:hypothetical protein
VLPGWRENIVGVYAGFNLDEERKKRRSTGWGGEGGGGELKEGMGATVEKPPVVREDSSDSVKTFESSSTDEGQMRRANIYEYAVFRQSVNYLGRYM